MEQLNLEENPQEQNAEAQKQMKIRELIQSYCEVPEQEGDEAPGRWFLATTQIVDEIVKIAKTVAGGRRKNRSTRRNNRHNNRR